MVCIFATHIPLLVKIDKKKVQTFCRKSIEHKELLRYNKDTKKYENSNYICGMAKRCWVFVGRKVLEGLCNAFREK